MQNYEDLRKNYEKYQLKMMDMIKEITKEFGKRSKEEDFVYNLVKISEIIDCLFLELEHNQSQHKLNHEMMTKIFDNMSLIILLQNPTNGGIVYMNNATNKIFSNGVENEKKRFQLLLVDLLDIGRGISTKKQYFDEVHDTWYSVSSMEIDWDEDEKIYFHTLTDITGMKKVEELLINEANIDRMTGVFNRSGGKHEIYKVRETLKDDETACLCMIDLDGLKKINDTYGHNSGDTAIIAFVNILKSCIDVKDFIVRMGGDEFVVLFKKSLDESEQVIQNIREKLNDYNVNSKQPYRLRFSCGMCEFTNQDRVLGEIISRADKMMYREKKRKKTAKSKLNM